MSSFISITATKVFVDVEMKIFVVFFVQKYDNELNQA